MLNIFRKVFMKCRYNILNVSGVSKRDVLKVPIVDNELQIVFDLDLLCHLASLAECFAHDGYQHIQKMDQQNELSQDAQSCQVCLLTRVAQREGVCAAAADHNVIDVVERIE